MIRHSRLSRPLEKMIFAGGQAPSIWQRDLTRHATWISKLEFVSAWIKTLAGTEARLMVGPLMGYSLEELTEHGFLDSTEMLPETPLPMRFADISAGFFRQRERALTTPDTPLPVKPSIRESGPQPSHDRMLPPRQLESSVKREFLSSLAGETARAYVTKYPQRQRFWASQPTRNRSALLPQVDSDEVTGLAREWLDTQTQRVERTLCQHNLAPKPTKRRDKELPPDSSHPETTDSLAAQWALPLPGQAAPAELLIHLVSEPENHSNGASSKRGTETKSRHSLSPQPMVNEGSDGVWDVPVPLVFSQSTPPRDKSQGAWFTQPSLHTSKEAGALIAPSSANDQTIDIDGEQGLAAASAPSQEAPMLPALHPRRKAGEPVLPQASDFVKPETKQVEVASGEEKELNDLSAQIKRILDEEARRHGIDV